MTGNGGDGGADTRRKLVVLFLSTNWASTFGGFRKVRALRVEGRVCNAEFMTGNTSTKKAAMVVEVSHTLLASGTVVRMSARI